MVSANDQGAVALAGDRSALQLLHALLSDAASTFPDSLDVAQFPDSSNELRRVYAEALPRLEAARLASPACHDMAAHVVAGLGAQIVWRDDAGDRPLREALADEAEPLALRTHAFTGPPGWVPSVVYRGERWEADRLVELGALLVERNVATRSVGEGFEWISRAVLDGGGVNLSGRKIAVLGGGAEMAPTRFWLEAGADVLWLDTQPPPLSWQEAETMSGRLSWPEENVDLLAQPREALATLRSFAAGQSLDLGLYAYAPGQAREVRLTATMNALVDALSDDEVASVTMLVSPSTPTQLTADDMTAMEQRRATRPAWEAVLDACRLLGKGGVGATVNGATASRTVVTTQGASYQAAQYLGKTLVADAWSQRGLRVSANTAAITRTRSLAHPVFAAAFGGAAAFGVETLAPRQSRAINGLLSVRDWLSPELPTPGAVRVHGGIHTLPYPLEPALRVAAAIGFARSPRLLRGLVAAR